MEDFLPGQINERVIVDRCELGDSEEDDDDAIMLTQVGKERREALRQRELKRNLQRIASHVHSDEEETVSESPEMANGNRCSRSTASSHTNEINRFELDMDEDEDKDEYERALKRKRLDEHEQARKARQLFEIGDDSDEDEGRAAGPSSLSSTHIWLELQCQGRVKCVKCNLEQPLCSAVVELAADAFGLYAAATSLTKTLSTGWQPFPFLQSFISNLSLPCDVSLS